MSAWNGFSAFSRLSNVIHPLLNRIQVDEAEILNVAIQIFVSQDVQITRSAIQGVKTGTSEHCVVSVPGIDRVVVFSSVQNIVGVIAIYDCADEWI